MEDFAPRPAMIPPAEGDYDMVRFSAEARVAHLPAASPAQTRARLQPLRLRSRGSDLVASFAKGPASVAH